MKLNEGGEKQAGANNDSGRRTCLGRLFGNCVNAAPLKTDQTGSKEHLAFEKSHTQLNASIDTYEILT